MEDQKTLLAEIKQTLGTLPADKQVRIEAIAQTFRNILKHDEDGAATMAFALVGAELGAQD